jgi:hypothetical protein
MRQRIMSMKQKVGGRTKIYNIDSLKDDEVKLKYLEGICNKNLHEPEPSTTSVEEYWDRIKSSVNKNAEEVIGFRPKQERHTRFDERHRKIKDRNNALLKMLQQATSASVEEF